MILKQKFKTLEGAQKRCAFENAHSSNYHYTIEWFVDSRNITEFRAKYVSKQGEVKHWQLNKKRKLGVQGYKGR